MLDGTVRPFSLRATLLLSDNWDSLIKTATQGAIIPASNPAGTRPSQPHPVRHAPCARHNAPSLSAWGNAWAGREFAGRNRVVVMGEWGPNDELCGCGIPLEHATAEKRHFFRNTVSPFLDDIVFWKR